MAAGAGKGGADREADRAAGLGQSSLMEAGMGTNGMEAITAVSFGMGSILVDAAVAVGFLFLAKWIMTRKASVK